MFDQKDIDRFWEKVRKGKENNSCWIWIAGKIKNEYGLFLYKKKKYVAHVFAFMITHNIILTGREIIIRHKCNNPSCVNPSHLIDGTHKENMEDCIKTGTAYNKNVAKGAFHYKAILTQKEINKIRQLGLITTGYQIAKMPEFKDKISQRAIYQILNNERWKEIK